MTTKKNNPPPSDDAPKIVDAPKTLPVSEYLNGQKPTASHQAAAALHRWAAHKHHMNGEIELTSTDYELAIKAAETRDPRTKKYKAHPAALFTLKTKG